MLSQHVPFFANALSYMMEPDPPKRTIPNDMYNPLPALWIPGIPHWHWELNIEDLSFMHGAIVSGAVHLLTWNFGFPSPVERTLWRIASVATAAMILGYYDL